MAQLCQLLSINTRLVLVQSKSSTFWLVSKEIQAESVPHAKISTDGEKNSSSMLPTLTSGETLCRDNRRLIGTPLIVIARQSQKNRD